METRLMNVEFARRDLNIQVVYYHIKEHTPETNLMNVTFARRDLEN
jgi:hypothetical protein